jgi:hypothetical protein
MYVATAGRVLYIRMMMGSKCVKKEKNCEAVNCVKRCSMYTCAVYQEFPKPFTVTGNMLECYEMETAYL